MDLNEKNSVLISTKKYSQFFKAVFKKYNTDCTVEIDGKVYKNDEINDLISNWCVNNKIINTRDFLLSKSDDELFYFHDHPEQLMGAISEKEFIENLARDKIIKIKYIKQAK